MAIDRRKRKANTRDASNAAFIYEKQRPLRNCDIFKQSYKLNCEAVSVLRETDQKQSQSKSNFHAEFQSFMQSKQLAGSSGILLERYCTSIGVKWLNKF